jgi:hypothetical protein
MAEGSATSKAEEAKKPTAQDELGPEELAESLACHLVAAESAASTAVQRLHVPLRILSLSSSEALHCLEQLQHHAGSSPPERAALLLTLTDWAVAGLLGAGGLFQPDCQLSKSPKVQKSKTVQKSKSPKLSKSPKVQNCQLSKSLKVQKCKSPKLSKSA